MAAKVAHLDALGTGGEDGAADLAHNRENRDLNTERFAAPQNGLRHLGRVLLGLYFVVPGIMKILGWSGTAGYMEQHGVPFVPVLLALTIVLQVGGGAMLALGIRTHLVAFVLAGLTLAINVFMHDFWNTYEGVDTPHEMQNFIKNLGIMAGLLYVAGTRVGVDPRD